MKRYMPPRPARVVFTDCADCPPELVREWVRMPSGDIVVRVECGESYWFDAAGNHPKSRLEWQ